MDDSQQDQYVERLKEVFNSFDTSAAGSLCPEELSNLCQALHLEDATPTLLSVLLQSQEGPTARVEFDQFKNALISVLSTTLASSSSPPASQESINASPPPDSLEVQAKFVRGSKRYGRRSTPEFIETMTDASAVGVSEAPGQDPEDQEDSTVPRKRERWNTNESSTEEYEAEGQLHLWNPDDPSTPRGSVAPPMSGLEDRVRQACEDLSMPWYGCASHSELLALCDHLSLEVTEDVLQVLLGDGVMSVQTFASWYQNHAKPPTPSASTPYRQLKRLHSQPFDETGRRTSTFTSTIGMSLFSTLDDGTGFTPAEYILDAWLEEGIEDSPEILQALDFDLEGKVNLSDLTSALENELLTTKNGIHQAALISFKAEIRYLLERVDRERQEKEKMRSDLEKAERLKTQMASEVDEHHTAIERINEQNLRKLEEEHREKLVSVRSELIREMDQMQQQTGLQREELEAEIGKIRDDEMFLREHLSITVKESRRLEMELLESTEKLVEAENQVIKLQRNLDNILKEKFGDLDPGSVEFFLQEERIRLLRSSYDEQCRELQDRIDDLQAELKEYQSLGRTSQFCLKASLSEELENKSPGMESDPGIGSEEGQPLFNISLEAEMMLEQLKENHVRESARLESKISELDQKVEEQQVDLEVQKAALSLQYQEEIQSLQEQMSSIQHRALELQAQLEEVKEERACLEQRQAEERDELERQQEEEVSSLRQELLEAQNQASELEENLKALEVQLLEAQNQSSELEENLKALEAQRVEAEVGLNAEFQELRKIHALELNKLDEQNEELLQTRLEEERRKQEDEKGEVRRRLLEKWEREKVELEQSHEVEVKARIEAVSVQFQAEREELEMRLKEEWEREKARLDEQNAESFQTMLEEEIVRLVKEQEEREARLTEQWKLEQALLQQCQEEALLTRLAEERQTQRDVVERRLREEWDRERLQLEEEYEDMLQGQIQEERERLAEEKEELEKRLGQTMEDEKERLEEVHRQALQDLGAKHSDEREQLSRLLDKLREDVAEQRSEANRLAEENLLLRHKISTLKEKDLREPQEDMFAKLQNLRKEKASAQKKVESFKRQIADLRLRNQQLEDENGLLSEKNAQNAAGMEGLSQQLEELQRERLDAVTDQHHTVTEEDRTQMAVCVSALEAELSSAVEGSVLVEENKAQLMLQLNTLRDQVANMGDLENQLSQLLHKHEDLEKQTHSLRSQLVKSQERTQVLDESLQLGNLQSAHLKSDLRMSRHEKDALKQEVMSLHKRLQKVNDKNRVLEMTLHSSGFQSKHKKLYRDELARLVEQEQHILRQDNERLAQELHIAQGDLNHTREKARQLEATVLTLQQQKQQCQSAVVKTVEQEKTALKKELDRMHQELLSAKSKVCEDAEEHRELEGLRQENEGMKTQQAWLHAQLVEALQVQLGGRLPPSPHRIPGERRGHYRGDDHHPENIQDEGAMMMMIKMEERMKEIELSLHNVKLLLKEKVSQLKDQLHKNGRADSLIKDLYVENAQLLRALEMTEQRQKVAEKKNYLLEEKICTLNKIVRDMNSSPIPALPYHYTCS
ncbi:hypothetical protein DPEC_G00312180 [Dallia pectoralis]|uniref:Uncharacterized protein n=1 Tax=Dallia pectoralis TaxID=75939 RepID=A0ACC2FBI9_DALPE|nr:hypothetical protein DPEC_G00312180 [Dallia pectoralis]